MKLRAYHAGDGDCLLVTSAAGGRRLLIDGGRKGSFDEHTLEDLGADEIDVVCVSHIDDDHISGILGMFELEVDWRKHEFLKTLRRRTRKPARKRPPKVAEIWHNALFELVGEDLVVSAVNALATSSEVLRSRGLEDLALANENIALGERAGIELSRRVSGSQLGIELNRAAGGRLLKREDAGRRRFGGMNVRLIGPSEDDVERLRTRWKKWIDDHPSAIDALREELRDDEANLGASQPVATAGSGRLGEGASGITAPNLASIMLLLEEDGESILLTGDGSSEEVLEGLEAIRRLAPIEAGTDLANLAGDQQRHVTVLKVPHHGAIANVTEELIHRVTADHYVFCGNGAHDNPEKLVLRRIAEVRRAGIGPATPFTFWLTSAPGTKGLTKKRKKYMGEVKTLVEELRNLSSGQMTFQLMGRKGHLDVLA